MTADPWDQLRRLTPARIALGRTGPAPPTDAVLAFALDHARARDAVHLPFDASAIAAKIQALGHPAPMIVASSAPDRATYLRRPDLGRQLAPGERDRLQASASRGRQVALVVADGLSSAAIHAHAVPLIAPLEHRLGVAGLSQAIVVAQQARVALGDAIGEALGAHIVVVLIGERPGLSSPDSLGAYITFGPRVGRTDAERNCVSNIRPAGLSYGEAAHRIAWLVGAALRLGATGVALKDDSGLGQPLPPAVARASLPAPEEAPFADPLTARIVDFLREIGLPVRRASVSGLLPGVTVQHGAILVDEAHLAHPGDLLHEAGHLAVTEPGRRATLEAVGDSPGEEMAASAWSYAAALHLGLEPAAVFHADFVGGGPNMIAAFESGGGPGTPMLAWWGMTGGWKGEPRFPQMTRWLR